MNDLSNIIKIIEKNGLELKNINTECLLDNEYEELCQLAVDENAIALMYVQPSRLKTKIYEAMCKKAILSFTPAIRYVNENFIKTPNLYLDWCRYAHRINPGNMLKEQRRRLKPIFREIQKIDDGTFPVCGILLEPIEIGEEYLACSKIRSHVYKKDAMNEWAKYKGEGMNAKCVLCMSPIDSITFING